MRFLSFFFTNFFHRHFRSEPKPGQSRSRAKPCWEAHTRLPFILTHSQRRFKTPTFFLLLNSLSLSLSLSPRGPPPSSSSSSMKTLKLKTKNAYINNTGCTPASRAIFRRRYRYSWVSCPYLSSSSSPCTRSSGTDRRWYNRSIRLWTPCPSPSSSPRWWRGWTPRERCSARSRWRFIWVKRRGDERKRRAHTHKERYVYK